MAHPEETLPLSRWLTSSPIGWIARALLERKHRFGMPAGFKDAKAHQASITRYAQRVVDYRRWNASPPKDSDIGNPTPLDRMCREIIRFASDLPEIHSGDARQEVRDTQWEEDWLKTLNTVRLAMHNNIPQDYENLFTEGALLRLALHLVDGTNQEGAAIELNAFQRHTIQTVEQCLEQLPDPSSRDSKLWMVFRHYQHARQSFERARTLHAQWAPQTHEQPVHSPQGKVSAPSQAPTLVAAPKRPRF